MVLTAVSNTLAASSGALDNETDDVMNVKHSGYRRIVEDDSSAEEETETVAVLSLELEEDDSADSDDAEETPQAPLPSALPPRPKGLSRVMKDRQPRKPAGAQRRRRRRSSARFLRLTGRFEDQDEDDADEEEDQEPTQQNEHLGEMYKRAIRMNAENRINAGNSWGLRLIENIDQFLVEGEAEGDRVNFTKASCTIDASVKIYSYRVDDVHLTSYKVLANLNRTETGKNSVTRGHTNDADEDGADEGSDQQNASHRKGSASSERRGVTETLESNLANINISKLDSAYDIDPLFHKMSKTFDEGGAKGLLLANLGVGPSGCNIVFDSKEEATSIAQEEAKEEGPSTEGMVDISSLKIKLHSLLNGVSIDSIPLVPQLRELRQEYQQLDAQGFVDHNVSKSRSCRYAASQDEEKEAEMSIHQEALDRSRASQLTMAQETASQGGDSSMFATDDFGGDDDDDFGFTDFVAADENGGRYSSISFQEEAFVDETPPGTQSNTTALLDAICSGNALGGNDYEFFDASAVQKLMEGNNVWAGSAHWKRTERIRRKWTPHHESEPTKSKKKGGKATKKKKASSKRGFVDLSTAPRLDDVLRTPPKSKRGADPLGLSKAIKTKYAKEDNLLPHDAGIGIEQLSTLFLRPNTIFGKGDDVREKTKTVGFNDAVESWGEGHDYGGDDGSFGGDEDDGPGFQLADSSNDDFVINELEGVRKVNKIQVGYATVAKKVDVKRLKKDLWSELESGLVPTLLTAKEDDDNMEESDASDSPVDAAKEPKSVSFKNTVRVMESSQSQGDVTLSFYFICLLHLANEKGLRLESTDLEDFMIAQDSGDSTPSLATSSNYAISFSKPLTQRAMEVTRCVEQVDKRDDSATESDSDGE